MRRADQQVEPHVLPDEMSAAERLAYRRGMAAGILFVCGETGKGLTVARAENRLERIRWLLERLHDEETPLRFPEDLDAAIPQE